MARKASLLLDLKRGLFGLFNDRLDGVQVLRKWPTGDESVLKPEALAFGLIRAPQEPASLGPDKPRNEHPTIGLLLRVARDGADREEEAEDRSFEILDEIAALLEDWRPPVRVAGLGIGDIEQGADTTTLGSVSYVRFQVVALNARLR